MSFLALSGRESSLVQTFCESCEQLDITHPSDHMTRRFVIQGCPTLTSFINKRQTSMFGHGFVVLPEDNSIHMQSILYPLIVLATS